jgi:site-specific DNA recombinase
METELEILRKENQELRRQIEILSKDRGQNQKSGMVKKASGGNLMSRPPFGYTIINNHLTKDEEKARIVEEIFLEFHNNEISLNKLSQKHGFSLNGLKKILTNFTYLGKIKFNGEIHPGDHEPIISSTLFNQVQDKLENLKNKKINVSNSVSSHEL